MKEITYKELNMNPVDVIANEWVALVTGKNGDKVNAMTLSWGEMGSLWGHHSGMPVVTIYVRPQRFSKELLDKNEYFTLCFFGGKNMRELAYLGSHSGRDEDKIKKLNLHTTSNDDYSYINEASTIFVCRKLYRQRMKEECFLDKEVVNEFYPEKDFHDMYIAQIERIFVKE